MPQMPTLDVVSFSDRLWPTIAADWESLEAQSPDTSVFMSAEWIRAWIDVFGASLRPDALVWKDRGGAPVAACLVGVQREHRGPFTVRRAYLNATGEHVVASEHNTILSIGADQPRVHADLLHHLRARGADALVLAGFRGEPANDLLRVWPAGGMTEGYTSEDHFVSLSALRSRGQEYLSALSRNTREKVRRSIRLYEELHGPASVDVARTREDALVWFAELRRLHNQRWNAVGQPGAFATDEAMRFHERLIVDHVNATPQTAQFATELVRVRFGDVIIAVLYNLIHRGTIAFYQSGFHYADDNRLKPGLVAHALAIQSYLAGDADEYDFLAGEREASQYKRSLGLEQRPLRWVEYSAPTLKMRTLFRLRAWRDARTPTSSAPSEA